MAQLGSGNGTGYAATIDTAQTFVNGPNAGADANTRLDAEVINDLLAAVLALESTGGANPQGTYASIRARLDALGADFALPSVALASLPAVTNAPNLRLVSNSLRGLWSHGGTGTAWAKRGAADARDWGVKLDASETSTQFQAAVTACQAEGARLYVPAGTITLGTTINITGRMAITGDGKAFTKIQRETTLNANLFTVDVVDGFYMADLQLDGRRTVGNPTLGHALRLNGCTNWVIERVNIQNAVQTALSVFKNTSGGSTHSTDGLFANCTVSNAGTHGIELLSCRRVALLHNFITTALQCGVTIVPTAQSPQVLSDLTLLDNAVTVNGSHGIQVVATNATASQTDAFGLDLLLNQCLSNTGDGITITDMSDISLMGNRCASNGGTGIRVRTGGTFGIQVRGVTATANRCHNNGGHGILIEGNDVSHTLRGVSCSTSTVHDNTGTGITHGVYVVDGMSGMNTTYSNAGGNSVITAGATWDVLVNTDIELFNVKGFGAKLDGLTDDTAPINAAITACNAAGGGVVEIPRGTARLTGAIAMLSNVTLRGAGSGTKLMLDVGAASHLITATGKTNFIIRDVSLIGSGTFPLATWNGVYLTTCTDYTIDTVWSSNVDGVDILDIDGTRGVIRNCHVAGITGTGHGIQSDGGQFMILAENTVINRDFGIVINGVSVGTSIATRDGENNVVIGNTVNGMTGIGIDCNGSFHSLIANNAIADCTTASIQLKHSSNDNTRLTAVTGNVIRGQAIYCQDGSRQVIMGNTIESSTTYGVFVNSAPKTIVSTNWIYKSTLDGIYIKDSPDSIVETNEVWESRRSGLGSVYALRIENSSRVRVSGANVLSMADGETGCILIDINSTHCKIDMNTQLQGATAAAISDATSTTLYPYITVTPVLDLSVSGSRAYFDWPPSGLYIGSVNAMIVTNTTGTPTVSIGNNADDDRNSTATTVTGTVEQLVTFAFNGVDGRLMGTNTPTFAKVQTTGTGTIMLRMAGIPRN